MPQAAHSRGRLTRRSRVAIVVGVLGAATLVGSGWFLTGPILLLQAERALDRIYTQERPFAARLPASGFGRVREGHGAVRSQRLTFALRSILTAQRFPHSEAKAQLLFGRLALLNGNSDEAAGRYLRALKLDWPSRTAGPEFAAALLVRSRQQRRPVDLAAALEYAGKAHRFAPANSIDSYNLALLYESIPAPYLAREEWARCMRVERVPEWRAEAKAHWDAVNDRIEERARRVAALKSGPAAFLQESVRHAYPPEAAIEEEAPLWLARQREGAAAREALCVVAAQIQTRHGDPWLADLMRAAAGPSAPRAYTLLAEACVRNRDGRHEEAAAAAQAARELFSGLRNPAGELRARLELVIASHRAGGRNCLAGAQSLVEDLQPTSYTWLKAYAALEETTCHSIAGNSGRLASERERVLQWIHETGYQGLELRALGFLVEPELVRANPMRLWRIVHDGLTQFWAGDISATRAQQLYFAAALSGRDGAFPLASVVMAREGIRVMEEAGNPQWQALCHSVLGSVELAAGLGGDAAESFHGAEQIFAKCPQTDTVRRYLLEAETSRAEAEVAAGAADRAISRLRQKRNAFSAFGDTTQMAPFEQVLGAAFLRIGRYQEASASFDSVVQRTRAALREVSDQPQRDGILRSADPAHRGQIFLKLVRDHDAAGAFALWQSFRAARLSSQPTEDDRLPENVARLAVVALPGGWAVFAADRAAVEANWIPASSLPLDDLARAFTELCSQPSSPEAEIDRVGSAIYEAVILPFEKRLLGKRFLAIGADGALSALPWSALPDSHRRRLIERQTIVLGGDAQPAGPEPERPGGAGRPLVFAAPALSAELAMAYPPLGDSLREANQIARWFPAARILTGRAATAEALKENLPHSTFFHFGGHGTANGGYGAILLAPGPSSDGRFDASQIGRLNLRGVRVVSLASCSSGAGETAGPVNPDSLVHALLDAGVRDVIAAPWNVDSETTSDLFGDFYGRLALSGSAAEALQQACLRVSRLPGTGHPFYWSGFQIYGEADR